MRGPQGHAAAGDETRGVEAGLRGPQAGIAEGNQLAGVAQAGFLEERVEPGPMRIPLGLPQPHPGRALPKLPKPQGAGRGPCSPGDLSPDPAQSQRPRNPRSRVEASMHSGEGS